MERKKNFGSENKPSRRRRTNEKPSAMRNSGDKGRSARPRKYNKTEDETKYPQASDKQHTRKRDEGEKAPIRKNYKGKPEKVKQMRGKTEHPDKQKQFMTGDEIRLNKYIANAGICSRREADNYIKSGTVTVNGEKITELGTKIRYGDKVNISGQTISPEKKVYLLLNKPKDFVTTVDDPHATKTVMHLIRNACTERIYPVGRLDRNSTGVLLFTNDGELTKRLTHPKYLKKKIYHVWLDKDLTKTDLEKFVMGIELDDGLAQADAISFPDEKDKKQVGIEIHSGKNRVIRRMFEAIGYNVTKLDRVYFAGLTKKNLSRGKWRFLDQKELNLLKMNAFK